MVGHLESETFMIFESPEAHAISGTLRHILNQDTMKMSEKRKSININKIGSYDNKEP